MSGYYWCDKCDEAAARICQTCHQDARWIVAVTPSSPRVPATPPSPQSARRPVTPERGREFFADLRRKLLL